MRANRIYYRALSENSDGMIRARSSDGRCDAAEIRLVLGDGIIPSSLRRGFSRPSVARRNDASVASNVSDQPFSIARGR